MPEQPNFADFSQFQAFAVDQSADDGEKSSDSGQVQMEPFIMMMTDYEGKPILWCKKCAHMNCFQKASSGIKQVNVTFPINKCLYPSKVKS